MNFDNCQLAGAPPEVVSMKETGGMMDVEMKTVEVKSVEEQIPVKRKRGRPPKNQPKVPMKKDDEEEEEDVCFICFDGGSLVLCDRKGCPKAYHPACIKRDEAFFQSKTKWNCGWHICSSCQKASHYMCYTCTYSLCKRCTKDADYVSVRGNNGFCGICMRTVMLLENNVCGNSETVQVDFDDKSSWEYLFKMYWVYLKEKLSLTCEELSQAKNPWKVSSFTVHKEDSTGAFYDGKQNQLKFPNKDSASIQKPGDVNGTHSFGSTEWASKELLEFVSHMKNDDTSMLSQFDVQTLLLEYIKRNNLRDPHQKCQIICDSRLIKLFGRERVGHIEMLKLIEFHFLLRENSTADDVNTRGSFNAVCGHAEADVNNGNPPLLAYDKKRKTRKMSYEEAPIANANEYAAIDVHNVNLIYVPRNLMENLIGDTEKFHDKVVGSIVRIRISSSEQKQDMHRLVQVVGTSKVDEPYKVGAQDANVMLEILNLNKKETISIDAISNQEFTKDECRRLRQSIKCGLISWWTVGDIRAKAKTLQAVKVNDWFETEILRVSHLRDRASEKGHRKELREHVEKLQLLNSPEERQRRLLKIPEVHPNSNTDPGYESEEAGELHEKKQDDHIRPNNSRRGRKGRKPVSSRKDDAFCNIGSRPNKNFAATSENRDREEFGVDSFNIPKAQINVNGSFAGGWTNEVVLRSESFSHVASEVPLPIFSTGMKPCANNTETDKLWHYQDPMGRIQGPFPMAQLRKWSASGHFPHDLRVWKTNEKQMDSILLTDALVGHYYKEMPVVSSVLLHSQEFHVASDHKEDNGGEGSSGIKSNTETHHGSWNSKQNDTAAISQRSTGLSSQLSHETSPAYDLNSSLQGWDSLKEGTQPQASSSLPPFTSSKAFGTSLHQVKDDCGDENFTSGQDGGNLNSHVNTEGKTDGYSFGKRSDSDLPKSSEQNWKPPPVAGSSDNRDCSTGSAVVPVAVEAPEQKKEIDLPDLPSPTPNCSMENSNCQAAENKQSVASEFNVKNLSPNQSTVTNIMGGGAQVSEMLNELDKCSHSPVRPSVEEWDADTGSASSLKPSAVIRDHTAVSALVFDEPRHSPPSHPTPSASTWPVIVHEDDEFSPMIDESVSDLLAEVEAMESLGGGLPSPTSTMKCNVELTLGKSESFDSIGEFSPTLCLGKSDATSFTPDLLIAQSSGTDNPQKKSMGQYSSSSELDRSTIPSDVLVNQWKSGLDIHPSPATASTISWHAPGNDTTWNASSELTDANWGTMQAHAVLTLGGLIPGNTNSGQVTTSGKATMSRGMPANHSTWQGGQQQRNNDDRHYGPRDHDFRVDSRHGKSRSSWSNHPLFGGDRTGGGASPRPTPKGQRICKFYEKGYCRKGSACDYFHP